MKVRRDRGRTTSARDDGRYEQDGGRVKFRVTGGGRTLRNFTAQVTALCFGATVEENRFMILFAGIDSARIAPDGSVTGLLKTKSGDSQVQLTGRLREGSFKGEAFMFIRASRCVGRRKVEAVKR